MLHQLEEECGGSTAVMIPASTQGINVTCEVLFPFLVAPNSLFVVWVSCGKTRQQTATHTHTHRYFDFSEEMTGEEQQDKNTAMDKTQNTPTMDRVEGKVTK